jgi:hypothetical protein
MTRHNLRRRYERVVPSSPGDDTQGGMSYNLSLQCGCVVYVSCHPQTRIAHTRVIESRGQACATRRHEVGLHLYLWEILPDGTRAQELRWSDVLEDTRGSRM